MHFFKLPSVPWALESCILHYFFLAFVIFCCFFCILASPYQAARKPAFSGLLGPGNHLRKSPGTQKWWVRGLFYAFWKTHECITKNKVSGHFGTSKIHMSSPPLLQVNRLFENCSRGEHPVKMKVMRPFLILKKEFFSEKCLFFVYLFFATCSFSLFSCFFWKHPIRLPRNNRF